MLKTIGRGVTNPLLMKSEETATSSETRATGVSYTILGAIAMYFAKPWVDKTVFKKNKDKAVNDRD